MVEKNQMALWELMSPSHYFIVSLKTLSGKHITFNANEYLLQLMKQFLRSPFHADVQH